MIAAGDVREVRPRRDAVSGHRAAELSRPAFGILITNVVPAPGVDSTSMSPL